MTIAFTVASLVLGWPPRFLVGLGVGLAICAAIGYLIRSFGRLAVEASAV